MSLILPLLTDTFQIMPLLIFINPSISNLLVRDSYFIRPSISSFCLIKNEISALFLVLSMYSLFELYSSPVLSIFSRFPFFFIGFYFPINLPTYCYITSKALKFFSTDEATLSVMIVLIFHDAVFSLKL